MSDKSTKPGRNRKQEEAQETAPNMKNRLSQLFDIPQGAMMGVPQIEIAGNREAVIDGCQGILAYDESMIRLACGKQTIAFSGRNLQISALTRDSAVVTGFITRIEFIT